MLGAGSSREILGPASDNPRDYVAHRLGPSPLATRVARVLAALPDPVRRDLLDDPCFHLALDDYQPGRGRSVWLACPVPGNGGSRSVVLKPRLADCDEAFAHYVIAHELAHAHLRNGGWGDIHDPEWAADALAASWGFPRCMP